jgi:uncharacterized protein
MRHLFTIFILLSTFVNGFSQSGDTTRFYHRNGKLSSIGIIRDGKPDGYWQTYNENGILKSEGNRLNFELDGLWKFYDDTANLVMSIHYREGKKNGMRTAISSEEIIEEEFKDDVKHGLSTVYFPNKRVKRTIIYENGLEHGLMKEYNDSGMLISLIEYRRGFIVNQEFINRYDNLGRKNGLWKEFWPNGNLKKEYFWRNGVLHGYMKYYNEDGKLQNVEKYINDELILDAKEVALYEIRYDYYPDGSVKIMGSYRDNVANGIRKEFSKDGTIEKAYIMANGFVIGEGLIDGKNKKQGPWKEYYETGELQAEGTYSTDIRTGLWRFWYQNGQVEQIGKLLNDGSADSLWLWYYPTGKLRRQEFYSNGAIHGIMIEFDANGDTLLTGLYQYGLREGRWVQKVNTYVEEGEYINDVKEGSWRGYYIDGASFYEGSFVDGQPDGVYKHYWETGTLFMEGRYNLGLKEGEWKHYNREGKQYLSINYKNGIEISFNNMMLEPLNQDSGL